MKSVIMDFIEDGGAINFDIGFIPDHVRYISKLEEGSGEVKFDWYRARFLNGGLGLYGISSAEGVLTLPTTAATGIIPYTEGEDNAVLITHPDTGKLVRASVLDWTKTRSDNATARSITALGTVLRPTKHNGRVYECTTDGTGSSTEPTDAVWDVQPGETVTDGSTVFTARKEIMTKGGGMGFTIGVDISTDGDECLIIATEYDKSEDVGDVDGLDPVKFSEGRADA